VDRSGQFVIPGDKIGVIEEFLPGPGTYVSDGEIYSSTTGHMMIDASNKTVSVYPHAHLPIIPQEGKIVTGQVSMVQDKIAVVQIFNIGKKHIPSGLFTGNVHISMVSRGFVESMFNALKTGDIILAKVINDKNASYQLSIADRELGVLYAFCSRCGNLLILNDHRLQCPMCKNVEERKIALEYGVAAI
jgi:exosome complex component CSL4